MKSFKILALILILSFPASISLARDTTLYKVKIAGYQSGVRNGKIITTTGACAIISGFALTINGKEKWDKADTFPTGYYENEKYTKQGDRYIIGGVVILIAGVATLIPGIITWSNSKRKVTEYRIRLDDARSGPYLSPDGAGISLSFRF